MNFLKKFFRLILNPSLQVAQDAARLPGSGAAALQGDQPHHRKRSSFLNLPLFFGLLIIFALLVIMLLGPFLVEQDPFITSQAVVPHYDAELGKMVKPPFLPSREHPLGTDSFGNDILAWLVYGSRTTLIISACITLARVRLGAALGLIAGWNPERRVDRLIMAVIGVVTSIPMLLSSVILIFALGIEKGPSAFIVALTAIGWTEIAQQVRAEMLVIRKAGYIEGAKSAGLNDLQTVVRHALPNLLPQLLVMAFFDMGVVLILLAELGFLGVYIGGGSMFTLDPTYGSSLLMIEVPEWGALLASGTPYLRAYPHLVMGPGLAFFISVLGFNMLGEGLRRVLDRSMISTAFILKKEGLLAAVGLLAVIAIGLNFSSPQQSYRRLARAFQGQQALEHLEALAAAQDSEGLSPEEYMQRQFKQLKVQPGLYRGINSTFNQVFQVTQYEVTRAPELAVQTGPDGHIYAFQPDSDFQYVLEGRGGAGSFTGSLAYLSFNPQRVTRSGFRNPVVYLNAFDFSGLAVMTTEEGLPPEFEQTAVDLGAQAILLITSQDLSRRPEYSIQLQDSTITKIPIFRISPAAAQAIFAASGQDPDELHPLDEEPFALHELGVRVSLSLDLSANHTQDMSVTVGFIPGYDQNLADELVILAAGYDVAGPEDQQYRRAGVGLQLELARLLQEGQLDSRRSILFVAWDNNQAGKLWAQSFFEDDANFSRLSIPSRQVVHPRVVIWLDDVYSTGETIWISPQSDEKLSSMFSNSARWAGLRVETGKSTVENPSFEPVDVSVPSLQIQSRLAPDSAGQERLTSQEWLQKLGESLSLMVIPMLRQEIYW